MLFKLRTVFIIEIIMITDVRINISTAITKDLTNLT